jgi:hypothetical protein
MTALGSSPRRLAIAQLSRADRERWRHAATALRKSLARSLDAVLSCAAATADTRLRAAWLASADAEGSVDLSLARLASAALRAALADAIALQEDLDAAPASPAFLSASAGVAVPAQEPV